MSESIYVPIVVIVYFIIMIWYSTIMSKVLNTNLAILIVVGIFFPPLWLIFAIVSLAYQANGKRVTPARAESPKTKVKKSKASKK